MKSLHIPFTKMVQSIVRKYPVYIGTCGIEELDAMTYEHLLQNMHKYFPFIVNYQTQYMDKPKNTKEFRYNFRDEGDAKLSELIESERLLRENNKPKIQECKDLLTTYELMEPDGETTQDELDLIVGDIKEEIRILETKTEYNLGESKAYSYLGTICRNFLKNHGKKTYEYESKMDEIGAASRNIENNRNYQYSIDNILDDYTYETLYSKIIESILGEIETNLKLKVNDVKVGHALILIFENWEKLSAQSENDNTNFFTKKKIYQILKDITELETPEITQAIKHYTALYSFIKGDNEYS